MKKSIFSFIIILSLNSFLFSEDSDIIPISSGERFNERGFMGSASKRINGNEIISDYDGNFSLVYSYPIDLPNDLGGDLTVIYNPNVEHRVFFDRDWANDAGYSVNAPEWIIGYKGFALQTLNFEGNFYAHSGADVNTITGLTGEETPMLIPGYHYSNKIWIGSNGQPPTSDERFDVIEILTADGSKKTFHNESRSENTGNYLESGIHEYGYARVVEYDNVNHLRKMWYKPGDGLTYHFTEIEVKYNGKRYFTECDNAIYNPRVMALTSVTNPVGDTLKFKYKDYYYTDSNYYEVPGRFLFTGLNPSLGSTFEIQPVVGLSYNTMQSLPNMMTGEVYSMLLSMDIYNGINLQTTRLNIFRPFIGSPWLCNFRYPGGSWDTKIEQVKSIKDELGREDIFEYYPTSTKYQDKIGDNFTFSFEAPKHLMKSINYYEGKKTELEYLDPYGADIAYFDGNYCQTARNIFRDPEANFMLYTRTIYDSTQKITEEKYTYGYDGGCQYGLDLFGWNISTDSIWTKITKNKLDVNDNSLPVGNFVIKKYFTKYQTAARGSCFGCDYIAITRMNSEEIINENGNETIKNIFIWDEGNTSSGNTAPHYEGTFWLKEKIIEKYEGNTKRSVKKFTYNNTPDPNISFNTIYNYGPKYILKNQTATDPLGLKTYKSFYNKKSSIWSDISDGSGFYKIGMIKEKKVYKVVDSIEKVKSNKSFKYFDYGYSKGKLEKETDKLNNIYIDYIYNEDGIKYKDYNLYKGSLARKEINDQIITNYNYVNVKIDSVDNNTDKYVSDYYYYCYYDSAPGKLIKDDGSIVDEIFTHCSYQKSPFKTEIIYNDMQDTLVTYTAYDSTGTLDFEVDINGNYSEFYYDDGGRMIRAALPGSFPVNGDEYYVDSTIVGLNKNTFCQINFRGCDDGGGINKFIQDSVYNIRYRYPNNNIIDDVGDSTYYTYLDEYYSFLLEELTTSNLISVHKAVLNVNFQDLDITDQEKEINVYGVTQPFVSGKHNEYMTNGHIIVPAFKYNGKINVESMIETIKSAGQNLYGFKFDEETYQYRDIFLDLSIEVMKVDTFGTRATVLFEYDDTKNTIEMTKRFEHDPSKLRNFVLKSKYDSFGQLIEVYNKKEDGEYELKSEKKYNFMGFESENKDAQDRQEFYKYDYFSRPKEVLYVENDPSAAKKRFEYHPDTTQDYHGYKISYDEEDKEKKIYYDKVGNVIKEERIIKDGVLATTEYTYDDLYRLEQVKTPQNRRTIYKYDARSNIIEKSNPDEETTNYKYDKFGNLRFSLNADASSTDKALVFTKYDEINRPVLTGTLYPNYGFDEMDGDLDYSQDRGGIPHFEHYEDDIDNFVLVNMYDKYEQSGVFANVSAPAFISYLNKQNLKGKIAATAFRDKTDDEWNYKVYAYDHFGRVKEYWVKLGNNSWTEINNEYDNLGNLTKQIIINQFYYWYDYDKQSRLRKVWSNKTDYKNSAVLEAEYEYNLSGQIINSTNDADNQLTYLYNNRGWLEQIDNPSSCKFQENLLYYKNGNIKNQDIINNGDDSWGPLTFNYSYDNLNRLDTAICSNSLYTEIYSYNKDGDFLTKNRSGNNLSYSYEFGKHRLAKITRNGTQYNYVNDYKGNIISDGLNSVNNIIYDHRNLPLSMSHDGKTFTYQYDDGGNRIFKNANSTKEYYLRDQGGRELAIYNMNTGRLKMLNLFGNGLIGRVEVNWDSTWVSGGGGGGSDNFNNEGGNSTDAGGYWSVSRRDERFYYIKDHLGSVRLTCKENGDIVNAQDYYPFGEVLRQYIIGLPIEKYKFTEKERDIETGYDYFGARYYDPESGRWLSVDPLAGKYPSLSPYVYCANNPIIYFDPDGKAFYDSQTKNRISAGNAYTRTMIATSNYITNAKSNYAASLNTKLDFYSEAHSFYDLFEDISYHRENDNVVEIGKIGDHNESDAVMLNLQNHDKEIVAMAFKQGVDGDNKPTYRLLFSNNKGEVLVNFKAHSMDELNNILKDTGYHYVKNENGKWKLELYKKDEEEKEKQDNSE